MANQKDDIQLRSPEVQELIGHTPNGIIRYGIGIILAILIIILFICEFIPYQEAISVPIKVIPNVTTQCVQAPFAGTIKRCYVKNGEYVSTGDTLISIIVNGELLYIESISYGKTTLYSFCVPNEPVIKGQSLMGIESDTSLPKNMLAIADTLPNSISAERMQTIGINICGQKVPFKLVQIIENKELHQKRGLFQSDYHFKISKPYLTEGAVVINHGVLLDKLIQLNK